MSVRCSVLDCQEKGSLPVVATVFDKLNQVYKEYLEAEQSYTADVSHKFIIAVLMEYIRSLNQYQITVQVKPGGVITPALTVFNVSEETSD
ncbi:hypothetical protein XENOCAPTIV_008786 [Xenoophorus captivus]|uniref:Mic1 domain-containing protein n=1 Tax=Xenoophorus captivus TaxID=1517983 RepID=A0ABV0RRZ4_9TELE